LWRQIFADAMKVRVVKTNVGQEAGSLGAAAVAAVGAGLWEGFERIDGVHRIEAVAAPDPHAVEVYEGLLPVFERARRAQSELGDMLAELDL